MTSKRVYNKVKILDEAIKELKDNIGTQFDPELTIKFIDMVYKNKYKF